MSKNEFVKEITNIDEDFAQWYTDIVLKTELADYAETKGCITIRPYGYAIWENIQNYADKKFKKIGIKNTSFPVLIPESLLQKEKDHVEMFQKRTKKHSTKICVSVTFPAEKKRKRKIKQKTQIKQRNPNTQNKTL